MSRTLRLTYIGHSALLVEMNGVRLLTDPILRGRVGFLNHRHSPPARFAYRDIDAVLLSHLHIDHLDLRSLRRLPDETKLIVPRGAGRYLARNGFHCVEELSRDETTNIGGLSILATHAEHGRSRYPWGPFADALGFMIDGPIRLYFAGDTGHHSEMQRLAGRVDIALLPVWGWGFWLGRNHLDPLAAAEVLAQLGPELAVPIHWGTLHPIGVGWMNPRFLTEPPWQFARHAARVAPKVDVRVIRPGNSLEFCRATDGIRVAQNGRALFSP